MALTGPSRGQLQGRCCQIGHLLQQRLLVPRVLRLSEPPDVGDVLLLNVSHVGDGSSSSRGQNSPLSRGLAEMIWPCRHLQSMLVGVLGALVCLLRLLNGAHRISQCLAGVDTLRASSASTSEAPAVGVGVGHLARTTSVGPGGPA